LAAADPPPDLDELRADLHAALARAAGVPPEGIEDQLRLDEDLSLDSLKRIEALSYVSDKYGLDPDVDSIMELRTVGDVVRLAEAHLRGRQDPTP